MTEKNLRITVITMIMRIREKGEVKNTKRKKSSRRTRAKITRTLYSLGRYLSAPEKDLEANDSDLIVLSYLTIKVATDNFSKDNKLGEGGFGSLYKGKLRKGQ
ncbi:hypothetical protein RIF29_14253 [Crotalaria pallida]|uniref:Uncharacterized protein n=1 Tax=Crotalaria pallida TaxID=3830 RepID=A0AAN9ICK7_CROPI